MQNVNRTLCPMEPEIDPSKVDLSILAPITKRLENGTETYLFYNEVTQLVKMDFLFRSGTAFQSKSFCAAFTAQLLTEGTKQNTAKQIADFLEYRGAYIEKSIDKESVCITLFVLEKYACEVLPLLREMIEESIFPENEFRILYAKRKQQFEIESQKTSFLARNKYTETVFGSHHPYGKVGKIDDFEKLNQSDLIDFYTSHYVHKPYMIILSGKVSNLISDEINRCFGQSRRDQENRTLSTTPVVTQPQKIVIEKADAVQTSIRIGKVCMAPFHEDFAGLSVLNAVLGGYFGSRLMKNIREEKGYTYGIYSILQPNRELSLFSVVTDVGSNVTEQALTEIYKEIEILQTQPVSDKELDLVKNYLTGQFIRSIDGVFERSERYANLLQNGLSVQFYENYLQAIKKTTPEALLTIANTYLSIPSLFEVCAGNK